MTGVTHISVGAAIGKFIPNPFVAFLAGIVSHLILDKVPHYWPQTEKWQKLMMITESVIAVVLIGLLLVIPMPNRWSIVAGALGGASVDFVFVFIPFLVFKGLIKNPIRIWHEERQYHMKSPWFWLTDVVIISAALGFLL